MIAQVLEIRRISLWVDESQKCQRLNVFACVGGYNCFYKLHLHFEAWRVFCVEAPHATSACWSCGPATAACTAAGRFPVEHTNTSEYIDTAKYLSESTSLIIKGFTGQLIFHVTKYCIVKNLYSSSSFLKPFENIDKKKKKPT